MADFSFERSFPRLIPTIVARFSENATNHPNINDPNAWVPYRYVPSKVAAVIFVICFLITTAAHCWQMYKFKSWFFLPFVLGGFMEFIGYIGRIISTQNIWALGPFIMQSVLLLVAPAFFAASIYMTLRRIVILIGGEVYCFLPSRWISRIFVIGDVFSFLVQSSGAGMQASGNPTLGQNLIMAGLGLQVAFFVFFVVASVIFHVRAGKFIPSIVPGTNINWPKFMYTLYGVSVLILIRSLFRLIEYGQGNAGSLLRHEYWLYIFDALLMFLVMIVINVIHPGIIKADFKSMQGGPNVGRGSPDVEALDMDVRQKR